MKKPLILGILFLVLAAAFYFYKSYNKQHISVAETDAIEEVGAEALFSAFDTDEKAANTKYAEQVIRVKGTLLNRDLSNKAEPQIVLKGNGSDGFIRCGFRSTELDKTIALKDGETVIVKGLCKGFNSSEELDLLADRDVVLSKCIIIDTK